MKSNDHFQTRAIHIGNKPDKETGAVAQPIHLTSTFEQEAVGVDKGFDYSRGGNPTRQRLEENLATLENGKYGLAFASGMAATTALFQTLSAGDHVIIGRNVYGGTYTVTNVGVFGSVMGTPIINQPQVGILALGAIRKVPAVIETDQGDFIGIRHKMFISHSYDHRVVNGALGSKFIKGVKDYLESWDVNREI